MTAKMRFALWATAALCAAALSAEAAVTPVRTLERWTGRVPEGVAPPLQSSIITADALQTAWTLCQVKEPMPSVDFSRTFVVLTVRTGTTVRFQNAQLVDGNLRTNALITPAAPAQTHCALALVERAGVKTVNGVPLGQ
jgi:hypothetical protein